MIDVVVFSLGCKVNQTEGGIMCDIISADGFKTSQKFIVAQNYVINTCSVTNEADKKSRQAIARALSLNKDANLFIVGCSSEYDAGQFLNKDNVKLVSGTTDKEEAAKKIIEFLKTNTKKTVWSNSVSAQIVGAGVPTARTITNKTRAFINVQDGCDCYCSYCIVPYLRGSSKSRELSEIITEAKDLSTHTKEIVITGINLSDYKIDGQKALTTLVAAFKDINTRKRLGSLYIDIIDDNLLNSLRLSNFCDHFHLSIQSGSDTVLRRMNRNYTAADILQKIGLIRKYFTNANITADMICGFPGETDKEFNETVELVKAAKFSDLHIFAYSERKGTKAAAMEQVEKPIRKDRASKLKLVSNTLKREFLNFQINKTLSVLAEKNSVGYSTNYIKVYYDNLPQNEIVNLKITKTHKDGLFGMISG